MHEQPRNRDWVKNAAIIFLVVLLVLTFFSNTIMNRSLPEVATQEVESGSIVARVRGTGTVQANSNTQVKMDRTRVIRSVLVKVGQKVEAGDVLFTLGEGASEEIDAAEDTLRSLQTSYNRIAATMPEYSYGADQNRLGHLDEAYREAVIAEEAALKAAELAAPNSEQKAKAESAKQAAIKTRDEAKKIYDQEMERVKNKTDGTLTKWQDEEKAIIEALYNNTSETLYYIEGFKYGGDATEIGGSNLISQPIYNDYRNQYTNGEDTLLRQIAIVEHRISELTSPSTGDVTGEIPVYMITWKDGDGLTIDTTEVKAGEIPEHDGIEKAASNGKTYIFEGWTPTPEPAISNAEYTATFSEESVEYSIIWKDDDGNVIDTTVVQYGEIPTHEDPQKSDSEDGKTYTFSGWTPTITAATSEAEYQATYTITESRPEEVVSPQTLEKTEGALLSETNSDDPKQEETKESPTVVITDGTNDININININTGESSGTGTGAGTGTGTGTGTDTGTGTGTGTGTDTDTDDTELKGRRLQLTKLQAALEDYRYIADYIDGMWNDEALTEAQNAYENAVLDVEKWETAIQVLTMDSGTQQSDAYKAARQKRIQAEEAYQSARQALREKIASNENTITGYNIDLADLWQQITKAKEKLDDLLGGEEATITAKVAGTIQTLDASPGDTKKKDDVIATIEAPDMGYTMSFSVTNDQANRLRVGDTGTVSNFYWGSEITATLRSIQIDQKNPQTNKLLTFDLSGNVTSGTELTVSVGQKSANYDVIIPSSSVRTDANGTYVLKLESKNSPLGNRYLARRVPVEVLAVDDTNSAVSADLGYGDYVITSSSSPLKNGQLVRLATSG